jgi:hypothetical protein
MYDTAIGVNLINESTTPIQPMNLTVTSSWNHSYTACEEKDNKITYAYTIPGIKIKCDKIFENKTKATYLHLYGEGKILNVGMNFDEKIYINTDIYNKYDWYVSNGVLYVVLFEKINKEPEFNRVEKPKKVVKEEVTE